MKLRKTLSALCAVAMLVSALPAASAAESKVLSDVAGETVSVQVVEETENGLASHMIKVSIPEGATKAEEEALVQSAALGRNDGVSLFSTNSGSSHLLSEESDLFIRDTEEWVGGNDVPSRAVVDQVSVYIVLNSFDRPTAKLYLQVRNRTTSASGDWKFISKIDSEDDADITSTNPPTWRIIYTARNSGLPSFSAGQGVDVYAKASTGNNADVALCTVKAYY